MNKELSKKISFLLIHEILIGCLVFPKIEKAYQNEKIPQNANPACY